jgi:hypothetical protein
MMAAALGLTKALGVTLAIVRKSRDLFWTAIGVLLMVRRGLSLHTLSLEEEALDVAAMNVGAVSSAAAADNQR